MQIFMPDKWCMMDYKNSLIHACQKNGVQLLTGTAATPQMILDGNFDAVIAACGSEPKTGPVPGQYPAPCLETLPCIWT